MNAESFIFDLPGELIAQEPPHRRGDARLLRVNPGLGVVGEAVVRDLPQLLRPDDLLVLNESRVLPARLATTRRDTGGQVEILLVAPAADGAWTAMARPARRLRPGVVLQVDGAPAGTELEVLAKADDGTVTVIAPTNPADLARRWGVMPLPPYIRRDADDPRGADDVERYQTVFAATSPDAARSVAAPTAGLHFSEALLDGLAEVGVETARVVLHVGPGTFQPPTSGQITARRLHREVFHLPVGTARQVAATRAAGGRVIAVGTTSLRVLETAARLDLPPAGGPDTITFPSGEGASFTGEAVRRDGHWGISGATRLFVAPPDRVAAADGLLTNFHLPGSSLLMLVAALLGGSWRDVYAHAVAHRLRFYSYGDAMLILPPTREESP